MKLSEAQALILNAPQYFKANLEGYHTWGKVDFLQIAVRLDNNQLLLSHPDKALSEQTAEDLQVLPLKGDSYFQKLLFWKWRSNIVVMTRQEYASQVKETIPAILDDQAQLLGINIKISKSPSDAVFKSFWRFATILEDGRSLCIGKTLEDAFVAAQLLEKTSMSWILGKALGGAKPINAFEAFAMQQYYLIKYSKEASTNV
ncbi:MAG: hypothetical protein M9887_06870 [Chitinophagales bacterium]|nr:hypothetical protein [Chitinophagales bacterium]